MNKQILLIGHDDELMLSWISRMNQNHRKPSIIVIKNSNLVASIKSKGIDKFYVCETLDQACFTTLTEFDKNSLLICPTAEDVEEYFKYKNEFTFFTKKLSFDGIIEKRPLRILKRYQRIENTRVGKLLERLKRIYWIDKEGIVLYKRIEKKEEPVIDKEFSFVEWTKRDCEKLFSKDSNAYILCSTYIDKKERGHHYQRIIRNEMIRRHVPLHAKLYVFIYKYNIPSYQNALKQGYQREKTVVIKRFLKHNINKEKIRG